MRRNNNCVYLPVNSLFMITVYVANVAIMVRSCGYWVNFRLTLREYTCRHAKAEMISDAVQMVGADNALDVRIDNLEHSDFSRPMQFFIPSVSQSFVHFALPSEQLYHAQYTERYRMCQTLFSVRGKMSKSHFR